MGYRISVKSDKFVNSIGLSDKELYVIELCLEKLKVDTKRKWGEDEDLEEALESIDEMINKIVDYLSSKGSKYVE